MTVRQPRAAVVLGGMPVACRVVAACAQRGLCNYCEGEAAQYFLGREEFGEQADHLVDWGSVEVEEARVVPKGVEAVFQVYPIDPVVGILAAVATNQSIR